MSKLMPLAALALCALTAQTSRAAVNTALLEDLLNCKLKSPSAMNVAYNGKEGVFDGLELKHGSNMFEKLFVAPTDLHAMSARGRTLLASEDSLFLVLDKQAADVGALIKANGLVKIAPQKDFPSYYFYQKEVRKGVRLMVNTMAPDYADEVLVGCAYGD